MANELNEKKPKPIGTPAPNYPKPKQEPAPAPKQQLAPKQQGASLGNVKVKPGSPFKSESVPVDVQQTKHESPKHVEKRVNKMFKDTNQPTLGIWNKDNTNPMADPNKIRFNPNLKYKPSKEQIEAANRKKIMQSGFAPKNWDGESEVEEPKPNKNYIKGNGVIKVVDEKGRPTGEQYPSQESAEDINTSIDNWNEAEDKNSSNISNDVVSLRTINHLSKNGIKNIDDLKKLEDDKIDKMEGNQTKAEIKSLKDFISKNNRLPKLEDKEEFDNLFKNYLNDYRNGENNERSKVSELFGTDLNKQQGYDYDRLSQELDSGDFVNLDAGLVPYEHGFETSSHEDLTVDARKNPETGKYEVHMYPETENGPVSGYEPESNEPTYEFDTFDDLKAFMENGYKEVEKPQWDPANNPGSAVTSKELEEFVKEQMKKDGGLNDNFIDAYVSNLYKNANAADYWKQKMKDAWDKKYGGNK